MAEDDSEAQHVCNHPRVEIDAWGQRLHGCVQCNQWMNIDGEWLGRPNKTLQRCGDSSGKRQFVHDAWRCLPMSHEIPTVPVGSIKTEQDGDDLFLLLPGLRVAKRGRPGTRKAKKWIPIVSWIDSVVDETDSSVIIRYAREKAGTA
jgi:hypothetical protein